jgi:hypothetical protein
VDSVANVAALGTFAFSMQAVLGIVIFPGKYHVMPDQERLSVALPQCNTREGHSSIICIYSSWYIILSKIAVA